MVLAEELKEWYAFLLFCPSQVNFTPFLEVCTYQEMQLLISGYEEFDAESILNCLQFENFTEDELRIIGMQVWIAFSF